MLWNYVLAIGVTVVASYLLGCCNTSIIISKFLLKDDVRNHGSGNAGLTNFYRVFGAKKILYVILADMLKTVLSVLLGGALLGHLCDQLLLGRLLGGIFCMLGHMYPVMFRFRGGKGVLAGGTMALFMGWKVALIVWGLFFLCLILSRFVSLGSLAAGIAFPFAMAGVYHNWLYTILGAVGGGLIIWGHRENIGRLFRGEESKLKLHK